PFPATARRAPPRPRLYFAGRPREPRPSRRSLMSLRHVVEVAQFDRPWLERLFADADLMRELPRDAAPLRGRILATLFYEPSTRTRLSFESAMHRLGGNVISTENAREFSS